MDEHKPVKRPGWPEDEPPVWLDKAPDWQVWAVVITIVVVVVVIAALVLLGPQARQLFNQVPKNL